MTSLKKNIASNPEKKTPCYFSSLETLGIIDISGPDASSFLQNLMTNDVNLLSINHAQLNSFCTPKGRLLAIFILLRLNDRYRLILPRSLCASLHQRLMMYVLRSNVIINDSSEELQCLGLFPTNDMQLDNISLPDHHYQASIYNDVIIMRLSQKDDRFLCVGLKADMNQFSQQLAQKQYQLAPDSLWELADIADGLPIIYPETKEKFTPQQVNLDLLGGVSFKKGCYPGQEVVARLHYLGQPSRRLFRAKTITTVLPDNGQEVINDQGDVAGHIVRWQLDDKNALQLLISLKLSALGTNIFLSSDTPITLIEPLLPE